MHTAFFLHMLGILKCTEDLESELGSSKEKAEQSYSVMLHETIYWPIYSTMEPIILWIKILKYCKVRTFWEAHIIWKNLPHGFDKSADLLSKRQNPEEDFFKLCVLLKKSELYLWLIIKCIFGWFIKMSYKESTFQH